MFDNKSKINDIIAAMKELSCMDIRPEFIDILNQLEKDGDYIKTGLVSKIGTPSTVDKTYTEIIQDIQNIKTKLVTNLKNKGVDSIISESLDSLVTKVNNILLGQGNAVESDVLKGKTFTNSDGILRTGNIDLGNLKPENIKNGININGIIGNLTAQSLGGKKFMSGEVDLSYNGLTEQSPVNGRLSVGCCRADISLPFTPSTLLITTIGVTPIDEPNKYWHPVWDESTPEEVAMLYINNPIFSNTYVLQTRGKYGSINSDTLSSVSELGSSSGYHNITVNGGYITVYSFMHMMSYRIQYKDGNYGAIRLMFNKAKFYAWE